MFFRFASPYALLLLPVVFCIWWLRTKQKPTRYLFPPTQQLIMHGMVHGRWFKTILTIMRLCIITVLVFLIARPQLVDESSKLQVEGIDMIIALDVSNSMNMQDYADDHRSRFQVAKDEASRFIKKRDNDAIGLVIFGNIALFRCPITMDKKMVLSMVDELKIGEVDPHGTMLSCGMLAAINRLKKSNAPSKVIILLTDGEPTEGDIDPKAAIAIARECGIKVYAIGIGSEYEQMAYSPFIGVTRIPPVNKKLLEEIAHQTGGRCFMARDAADMRAVYDTIDRLEKTKQELALFGNSTDLFVWPLIGIMLLLLFEQFLMTFIWFGL